MSESISLSARPRPTSDVIAQPVGDEAVLVHPRLGKVQVLNATGAYLWPLLDGAHTAADLASALCAAFDVSLEQARQDVLAFLEALLAKNAIRLDAEPKDSNDAA